MSRRWTVQGSVATLPDYSFGATSLSWWGVLGFMLIEGMGFVLAIGVYFYLTPFEKQWPPSSHAPPLLWGTVLVLVAVATEIPNFWLARKAKQQELGPVRWGLLLMTALALAVLVLRAVEMDAMNVRWDRTAYGSIVWAILVLHTFHTVTDAYDTGVLAALVWRKKVDGRKFSDIADNVIYWHFIVWSWVALYGIVYWAPRLL
jgi:cytochrome c oxidase subunit III